MSFSRTFGWALFLTYVQEPTRHCYAVLKGHTRQGWARCKIGPSRLWVSYGCGQGGKQICLVVGSRGSTIKTDNFPITGTDGASGGVVTTRAVSLFDLHSAGKRRSVTLQVLRNVRSGDEHGLV